MSTETVLTALISAGIFLMWIPACYIADKLMKLKKPKKHKKMHPAECRRTRCTHQNVQCYCNRKGA